MSKIGKQPVTIPQGVTVKIDGQEIVVKGPKGELKRKVHPLLQIAQENGKVVVKRVNDETSAKEVHGLTRTLVNNMMIGASQGYQKTLDIVGVGYRGTQQGKNILLQVGKSHPVEVVPPEGVVLRAEGQNRLHVSGVDKELVGLWAAKIRKVRPPDKYKGKGVRYAGEQVHLKPGKTAAKKA
ncbi:MAG: 50S ribosomal protein L6 [Chloroflexi bacterium]|nr:50S ribosomal protein L6 [Chloroflexota bacterium]